MRQAAVPNGNTPVDNASRYPCTAVSSSRGLMITNRTQVERPDRAFKRKQSQWEVEV